MYELRTEIEIDQNPDRVWEILAYEAGYDAWNPFVTQLKGRLYPGERISVLLRPPGSRGFAIRPRIVKRDEGREIAWRGKLWIPGIFNGEHHFEVHPVGNGKSRFVQWERFTGILVPVMKKMIEGGTKDGFVAMNRALKKKAESPPV